VTEAVLAEKRPTPEPLVRAAVAEDIPTIATLHARCFAQPWNAASVAGLVSAGSLALIGGWPGADSGFALFRGAADEVEVLSVGVDPEFRLRGMGRALLREGLAVAAGRGSRRAFLEVADGNAAAIALYFAAGFQAVGRRPRYYRIGVDQRIDALILAREL
jgi:ribosomal protein S18 acetylase RimI-like enzyme